MNKSLVLVVIFFGILASVFSCKQDSQESKTTEKKQEAYLKIAYNVLVDEENDDYEFFVMDFNGDNKKNICNSPGVDWVYHSYDDKLFFLSDRDGSYREYYLYQTDVNGSDVQRITDFRLKDSWMDSRNDGSELIVTPHPDVDSSFYIINLKGEVLSKIYTGLPYFNDPCFSPDGNKIVFRGSNKPFKKDIGFIDELYIMNSDGSGLRQLTQYPENDNSAKWHNYHAGPPCWNETTDVISYISKRNGSYSIFTTDASGQNTQQITPDGFNQGWHDWSTDGKFVVFNGSSTKDNPNYDIFLLDIGKRQINRLSFDSIYEQAPVFVNYYQNTTYE
ncbi:MAG: hypothetical protein KJO29_00050 [Bacteroidia bacterium]|nr:hypothetical protein [Bacteroidia bacterium]